MELAILPGGEVRAVWDDSIDLRKLLGAMPQRASRIEVVEEGRQRGAFHVDFSLLADATGDNRYRVCLARTFLSYRQANLAEIDWLKANWLNGDPQNAC